MRLHRFYVNKPLGEEIVVESADGLQELLHQWIHVFRYISGDEVILFSPHLPGTDYLYRIQSITKHQATLEPVSHSSNILPSSDVTLVMALVKKDTFETVVRQATELGVSRIIPLTAQRSEKKNLNLERLEAIAREASEQSGRGTVPAISQIMSLGEAFQATEGSINIVGSLRGEIVHVSQRQACALWVGPEGGWTDEEESQFNERGFALMKLTKTVLRADTAAVTLMSNILIAAHE